jgi:hypothetical protein
MSVTSVIFAASTTGSVFRIQIGNQVEVDPEEIHVTFDDVKGVSQVSYYCNYTNWMWCVLIEQVKHSGIKPIVPKIGLLLKL